ncbi:MAG: 50S ribosomal protein L14 [Thermoproteota archaeon]
MAMKKSRAVSAKGILEYRLRGSRGLPMGANVLCADNSGAKVLRIVQVSRPGSKLRRLPSAKVGDLVTVSVKKGTPDLKNKLMKAIIIRQRFPVRRRDGLRVVFEDNAAVLVTPEGDIKGTEVKGPVAKEAVDLWPKLSALASSVV